MWFEFTLQNLHFGLNLLVALVFFAVSWLYFDSWKTAHAHRTLVKAMGFLAVSLSYLVHSTLIESPLIISPLIRTPPHDLFFFLLQAAGLILIIASPS